MLEVRKTVNNWLGRRRGATVPFETAALGFARVSEDERDGLIAILRDFAQNGASFVVPWADLPRIVAMSERDKVVHQAVAESKSVSPAAILSMMNRLAASGLLGAAAKTRRTEESASEHKRIAELHAVLLLQLLGASGVTMASLLADPSGKPAQAALADAAAALGMKRADIYHRTGELSRLLLPVGFKAPGYTVAAGWLRMLHNEVAGMPAMLLERAATAHAEVAGGLRAIAAASSHAARTSGVVLSLIDRAVLDIHATLRRGEAELPALTKAVERLSWSLDPWADTVRLTAAALRGAPGDLAARLPLLRATLPEEGEEASPP
jgi:hypothetical protein